jgi:hypothetical protein
MAAGTVPMAGVAGTYDRIVPGTLPLSRRPDDAQ